MEKRQLPSELQTKEERKIIIKAATAIAAATAITTKVAAEAEEKADVHLGEVDPMEVEGVVADVVVNDTTTMTIGRIKATRTMDRRTTTTRHPQTTSPWSITSSTRLCWKQVFLNLLHRPLICHCITSQLGWIQ